MALPLPFFDTRRLRWSVALLASVVGLFAFAVTPARAAGTVRIQQSDGAVDTYHGVGIKIIHNALFLTSADGKGTLVINRAACFYQGEILSCFPIGVTLIQGGSAKAVDLRTGTIYANMTDQKQQLPLSSTQLPPHSILFSFSTKRGTYVNLSGTIDKATK